MKIDGFDWDIGNRVKCQRHGVGIAEIEALLREQFRFSPDVLHSITEQRQLAVGLNSAGRAMFVVFTVRIRNDQSLLRPITARYMHAKEARRYGTEKTAAGPRIDDR